MLIPILTLSAAHTTDPTSAETEAGPRHPRAVYAGRVGQTRSRSSGGGGGGAAVEATSTLKSEPSAAHSDAALRCTA